MTDYAMLAKQLEALAEEHPIWLSLLANASALIKEALPDINWAGFYLLDDGALVLGPFQGKPACMRIEPGHGVCGTAFAEKRTIRVDNVHEFPGHIACDTASNSEIVIPLGTEAFMIGVLDIDSPSLNRFTQADQEGLERLVRILQSHVMLKGPSFF